MRKSLTPRQQEIYDFIAVEILDRGIPPTIREIADRFEMSSSNGAREVLNVLAHKGYLKRHQKLSRGIELVEPVVVSGKARPVEEPPREAGGVSIPVLEQDSRDLESAIGRAERTIVMDGSVADGNEALFAARVPDESMRPSGFREGDLVVAAGGNPEVDECFVVAGIGGRLLVRRCIRRRDGYSLHADRAVAADRTATSAVVVPADGGGDAHILGTILGLVRTFPT